ncbi:hypothetical protein [Streptomyces sp. DH37]|uniref:hypothetical protein n=1 Tax=Streptomyces sp. DH37 TaxID=3040122 RepID=UPI00244150C9|nr:hypothetical protein [Streptomyces sp. DH37]MDG9701414.1 hypothetical protein [Streptomyces sp. DH37]
MSATSPATFGTTRPAPVPAALPLLRRLLALDAAVTGVNAVAYLALSGLLGRLLGVDTGLLLGAGAFLLPYSAGVGFLASRPVPPAPWVRVVVEGNLLWALAGAAALALGVLEPSAAGWVWIPLQAAVVAAFAVAQHLALRAVLRSPRP